MAPKKRQEDKLDTSSVPKITKKVIQKEPSAKKDQSSPTKRNRKKPQEPKTASPKNSGKLFGMPDVSGLKDDEMNILQSQNIFAQSAPDVKVESNLQQIDYLMVDEEKEKKEKLDKIIADAKKKQEQKEERAAKKKIKAGQMAEANSDTSPLNQSDQVIKQPVESQPTEYAALVAFYDHHTTKGNYTIQVKHLLEDISAVTHQAIEFQVTRGECQAMMDTWQKEIVPAHYEIWRNEFKNPFWIKMTSASHIKCIVQLITSTDISDNLIGQYAKVVKDQSMRKGFDFTSISYQRNLFGNAKIEKLVELIVYECTFQDKDGKQSHYLSPNLIGVLVRLGQIQKLCGCINSITPFNAQFASHLRNFEQQPSEADKTPNKSEYKIYWAIRKTYPGVHLKFITKIFSGDGFKKLAWPNVFEYAATINQQVQHPLAELITTGVNEIDNQPAELLKQLASADKDQWVLQSLAAVLPKANQTFTTSDIVLLVQKLALKGEVNGKVLITKNSSDLHQLFNLLQQNAVAVSNSVSTQLIEDKVKELLKDKPIVQSFYDDILKLAKDKILCNFIGNKFRIENYQIWQAAVLVAQQQQYQIAQIFAGQGKTYIMVLVGLYMCEKLQIPNVVFVLSSQILKDQMIREVGAILPFYPKFKICSIDEPDSVLQKTVYLVDEADEVVQQNFITFDKTSYMLNGCFHFKAATKVIFFSATLTDYMKNLITNTLDQPLITCFKSQYQLCSNNMNHFKIESFHYNNLPSLYADFLADLTIEKVKKPMIIFVEEWDENLVQQIDIKVQEIYKKNAAIVTTPDELETLQHVLPSQEEGAVILSTKFGRGINLRFACDADVRVIANGKNLSWEDVCQMVGRSSRTFGQCCGSVYVSSPNPVSKKTQGGFEYLNRNQFSADKDQGIAIANRLYLTMNTIKSIDNRKMIAKALTIDEKPVWRIRVDSLKTKAPLVYKYLTEDATLKLNLTQTWQ